MSPPSLASQLCLAIRLMLWSAIPLLVAATWLNSYAMGDWGHYYDPVRPLYVQVLADRGMLSCSWRRCMAYYAGGWESSFRSQIHGGRGWFNPPGPWGQFAFGRTVGRTATCRTGSFC